MSNMIFLGPIHQNPVTVNLPVAGAYLPGILVTEDGTNLNMATAANDESELLVLSNLELKDQVLADAYTSGDTGIAYRPEVGQVYQVRLAAATYALGDKLAVGANGRLEAAASGDVVRAYFAGTAGAKSAGDLDKVRIANSFVMA